MKKTARRKSPSSKSAPKSAPIKHAPAASEPSKLPFIIAGAAVLLLIIIGGIIYSFQHKGEEAVVTVNGRAITGSQLEFQYGLLPEAYRETFTREQVLEQIIDEELIVQVAQRQGVNATPEDINERVQQILAQNQLSSADLQTNLAELNVTLEQFEELIARQFIIDRYLNATLERQSVDNATLEAIYNASRSKYAVGEQVTARHILVSNQRSEAALIAKRIYDEARNGSDFCELVRNSSDDRGSRNNCGEYTFPRNYMVPEFEAAAFEMEDGEIRIVQTQFGYHIINKINLTPASFKPFEEVYDELVAEFEAADRSQQYRRIVSDLRARATIVYNNGTKLLPRQPAALGVVDEEPALNESVNVTAPENVSEPQNLTENVTAPNETTNATAPVNVSEPVANVSEPVTVPEPVVNITPNATDVPATNETAEPRNETNATAPQNVTEPSAPVTSRTVPMVDTRDLFACVASKATLYGTSWSSDTQDARALFAQQNAQLKYVECDKDRDACSGIIAYPTWRIDGQDYLGRMTLEQLKDASDCR